MSSDSSRNVKFKRAIEKLAEHGQNPEIKVLTDEKPIAFTAGLIKPKIYLSEGLIKALTIKELEAVILHELAHVERKDNIAIFSMLFLRDFLFMLPLAHFLFRVYIREKENAADDFAVKLMKEPSYLASALLKLVRLNNLEKEPVPAYATFFPSRATARARIVRLLGVQETNHRKEIVNLILVFFASILVVTLLTGATFKLSEASSRNGCAGGITCQGKEHDCCAPSQTKQTK